MNVVVDVVGRILEVCVYGYWIGYWVLFDYFFFDFDLVFVVVVGICVCYGGR